jgi:hypothetical protein
MPYQTGLGPLMECCCWSNLCFHLQMWTVISLTRNPSWCTWLHCLTPYLTKKLSWKIPVNWAVPLLRQSRVRVWLKLHRTLMRYDSYWTFRKNSLELIELFCINKVSLL